MNSAQNLPAAPVPSTAPAVGVPSSAPSVLRRLATLVEQATSSAAMLGAVAEELGSLIDAADLAMVARYRPGPSVEVVAGWSRRAGGPDLIGVRGPLGGRTVSALVLEGARCARADELMATVTTGGSAGALGTRSVVGVPVVLGGQLWGLLIAASTGESDLPDSTEGLMVDFTDIVTAIIAQTQAREDLQGLLDEQSALRAVATLVARGEGPEVVFDAVAEQAGRLIRADLALIGRRDGDHRVSSVAAWSSTNVPTVGNSIEVGGDNVTSRVLTTGQPARIDDYRAASGAAAHDARDRGIRSAVGVPITVSGATWGVLLVASTGSTPLAPTTEQTLLKFTDLAATAVANAQARQDLRRVADEQAALRRIATLVAKVAAPDEIFTAVAEAAGAALEADYTALSRLEGDYVELTAAWTRTDAATAPLGSRAKLGGRNVHTMLFETGQPARIDDYGTATGEAGEYATAEGIRSAVGAPITVDGRLWGALAATSRRLALPADTEGRLARFADLVATAIADAQARTELATYAAEQAALRRVASLVASTASPAAVFQAVASEVGGLLGGEFTLMNRYEESTVTVVGAWGRDGRPLPLPVGSPVPFDGRNVTSKVHQTSRPARVDEFGHDAGLGAAEFVAVGIRSAVGAPIIVDGRLWGVMIALTEAPLPLGTESRLADFTDLVATAIGNAAAYAALTASRARIVATVDETRRRIERDLHDGAQQRLVSVALALRSARAMLRSDDHDLAQRLDDIAGELAEVTAELRELARGIHPAILSEGGLPPAIRTLTRRSSVPVRLSLHVDERLPEQIEVAAYYVVSEALTNTAKYADATTVEVVIEQAAGSLHVRVHDDGGGGAQPNGGSGLVGLQDRMEALGGRLTVHSVPGQGTTLDATVPIAPG